MYEHCLFSVEWLAERLLASCKGQLNEFIFLKKFLLDAFTLQAEFHDTCCVETKADGREFVTNMRAAH